MKIPLNPLPDWIIAEQLESEKKTDSGIFLTNPGNQKVKLATILKVGTNITDIKPKMVVVYNTAEPVEVYGKQYLAFQQDNILAIKGE